MAEEKIEKVETFEDTVKKMNIYQKMLAITSEISTVAKNLNVGTGNTSYKAVGERDVLDAVKPLLAKYRMYCFPLSRELLKEDVMITTTKYGDRQSLYFHYKSVTRFINVDKPEEYIDVPSYSTGIDTGDKADGKAMTYADKYALMKTFMISTGEDPDQEKSTEISDVKYITKQQYEELKNMFTVEQIKEWQQTLGIKNGRMIPVSEYDKFIETAVKQNKTENKDFY